MSDGLKGANSRATRLFDVKVEEDHDGRAKLTWTKKDSLREWITLTDGCYVLRSNVKDWTNEDLWHAYMQLTEAELAFRIQKSDLRIRPIWHQKEDRVLAHILVCFLAYVLWKTLAQLCRRAGLGDEPRRVFDELGELRMVDVILPHIGRDRHPSSLREPPERTPDHLAGTTGAGAAPASGNHPNVVKTLGVRALKHKDLRSRMLKLGSPILHESRRRPRSNHVRR